MARGERADEGVSVSYAAGAGEFYGGGGVWEFVEYKVGPSSLDIQLAVQHDR